MKPEEIAALQTKVTTLEAANADLTTKLAKATADFSELSGKVAAGEKAAARAGIRSQIEGLVKEGRVAPGELETLTDFAAAQDDGTKTFDFTEGGKTEKVSARALFMAQLKARPVTIDFKERSGKEPEAGDPVAEAQKKLRDQVNGKAAA